MGTGLRVGAFAYLLPACHRGRGAVAITEELAPSPAASISIETWLLLSVGFVRQFVSRPSTAILFMESTSADHSPYQALPHCCSTSHNATDTALISQCGGQQSCRLNSEEDAPAVTFLGSDVSSLLCLSFPRLSQSLFCTAPGPRDPQHLPLPREFLF